MDDYAPLLVLPLLKQVVDDDLVINLDTDV